MKRELEILIMEELKKAIALYTLGKRAILP